MCCAAKEWDEGEKPDGVCPECETETYQGEAYTGCYYSPIECDLCGWQPCDLSC